MPHVPRPSEPPAPPPHIVLELVFGPSPDADPDFHVTLHHATPHVMQFTGGHTIVPGDAAYWTETGSTCPIPPVASSGAGGVLDASLQMTVTLTAGMYELCLVQGGVVVKHGHVLAIVVYEPPSKPPTFPPSLPPQPLLMPLSPPPPMCPSSPPLTSPLQPARPHDPLQALNYSVETSASAASSTLHPGTGRLGGALLVVTLLLMLCCSCASCVWVRSLAAHGLLGPRLQLCATHSDPSYALFYLPGVPPTF